MEYSAERTSVVFSVSTPDNSRFVRSVCLGGDVSDNASWAYAHTLGSDHNATEHSLDKNSQRQTEPDQADISQGKKNRSSVHINRTTVIDWTDAIRSSPVKHTVYIWDLEKN